jgi:hypothetical protein
MEIGAWEQRRHNFGASEGTDVGGGELVEVIGGGCLGFHSQMGRSSVSELLRMQARNQALSLSGRQHFATLLHTKGASVAKAVDEFRQLVTRVAYGRMALGM